MEIQVATSTPKIYSKLAVWAFSFFCTPLFGGVLLWQNLKDIGNRKMANMALLFSVLFTVLVVVVASIPDKPTGNLTYVLNPIGGLILAEYFFRKYIPNADSYYKKTIWKPLGIALVIGLVLMAYVYYTLLNVKFNV